MRKARVKGKVAFDTYNEPESKETKDLRKALSSKIPTEIDYYSYDAEHEEGTNIYRFQFPPEWRTLPNVDLVFGVRAFYSPFIKPLRISGVLTQIQKNIFRI